MTTSTELIRPGNSTELQDLCLALYQRVWSDPGLMPVGVSGQKQFGVDLLGTLNGRPAGIQCKCYNSTKFDLSVIDSDIEKADKASLKIDHLLFATTAKSDARVVVQVNELSASRKAQGKFTVSVDYWESIANHIWMYPEVGRRFVKNFPGSDVNRTRELVEEYVPLYAEDQRKARAFQTQAIESSARIENQIAALADQVGRLAAPQSKGDELNKLVAKQLDLVREKIRQDRIAEARDILTSIKDEALSADDFTKFRWHTNIGACLLGDDCEAEAAQEYLTAFQYAPNEEKALANRARALLLQRRFQEGLDACEAGLAVYPNSPIIWAIKLNARQLLKHQHPEEGLPEAVAGASDVLYVLSLIRQQQGNHEEAYKLALRQYEFDKTSTESKRAVLVSALSWATQNQVRAHFQHLSSEQRAALKTALNYLEPIEDTVERIQRTTVFHEIASNVAVALQLLGDDKRAQALVERTLRKLPTAESLLRLRIRWLDQHDDVAAVRALTEPHMEVLATDVLITLAEVSANRGDIDWHEQIQRRLNSHALSERQKQDLYAISVHAVWNGGRRDEAIRIASERLKAEPDNGLLAGILARMLKSVGKDAEANKWAQRFSALAKRSGDLPLIIQSADLHWDFGNYFEAADLYGWLVDAPGDDYITKRYLASLIESDQRERARQVIASLDAATRGASAIHRIEANLARQSGDWERLHDILKQELNGHPGDSAVAVGYVGALHRLQKLDELKAYLANNPVFDKTRPENEFEFAKYQSRHGFAFEAVMRLYRLFRQHPNDSRIAGYFLSSLLLSEDISGKLAVDVATPGTAVHLSRPSDSRWVAVEANGLPALTSWPEVIPPNSSQAVCIAGKKVGDKVLFDAGVNRIEYEISSIEHILLFASRKAHELIAANAIPAGPLWSVRVIKESGEPDIEVIRESLAARSKYVESVVKTYNERKFPICRLAEALGTDIVSLLFEWPFRHADMFVSRGTVEEREVERNVLRMTEARYVIDLLSLAELQRWGVFEAACGMLGKPLVPQTAKEQLLSMLQLVEGPKAEANMREEDGQLIWTDIPAAYFAQRKDFLLSLLAAIDNRCELVPAFGPTNINQVLRLLPQILDAASLDAVYLSLEHKAALVSDDGSLRLLATEAGITGVAGIQPLLMNLRDDGLLDRNEYSRIILSKLAFGHDFVSVDAHDLYWAVKHANKDETDLFNIALNSFRRATVDSQSVVLVCSEFLRLTAHDLPVKAVVKLYRDCLRVLSDGRDVIKDGIAQVLQKTMIVVLGHLPQPRAIALRKEFGDLLNEPPLGIPRLKPLVIAIHRALYIGK